MVGVISVEGRHVKGYAEPGLAVFKQVVESLVCVFRSPESREHSHGPQSATIHCRVDPSKIGVLSWKSFLVHIILVSNIERSVGSTHRNVRWISKIHFSLRAFARPVGQCLLLPLGLFSLKLS